MAIKVSNTTVIDDSRNITNINDASVTGTLTSTRLKLPGTINNAFETPTVDNIAGWRYTNKSFAIGTQDSLSQSIFFRPDGTRMYMLGLSSDAVYQYNLSTPWDISTATFTTGQQFSVVAQDTGSTGMFFKPDGLKMYILGASTDTVYQYTLSTAWDVTTATYDNVSFSVNAQDTDPRGIFFKPDGSTFYIAGDTTNTIYRYNLSTDWDISSAVLSSATLVIPTTIDSSIQDVWFNESGTKLYVVGNSSRRIIEYTCATPFALTTATLSAFFNANFETALAGIYFNETEKLAFLIGNTGDRVYEITTSTDAIENKNLKTYIDGDIEVMNGLSINGNSYTFGSLTVIGTSSLVGNVSLSGDITVGGNDVVIGSATSNATLFSGITTGSLSIATSQTAGNVNIGGTAATGTITIGNSTAAQTVAIASGNVASPNTGTVEIGNGATASGATRTIRIGTNGQSGSTTNVLLGSSLGVSTTTINGSVTLAATVESVNIAPSQSTSVITIGGTSGTGDINIGRSTASQTINIGTGATPSSLFTKRINIGTNGQSGSATNITLGTLSGTTVIDNLVGETGSVKVSRNPTQYLQLFQSSSGSLIYGYSAANNAKPVIFDSTTDINNAAPTTGTTGYIFRALGTDVLTIAQNGNITFNTANTINTGSGVTTVSLLTSPTTVNAFTSATTISMGAIGAGTTLINNSTVTFSNATTFNINGASPTLASSSNGGTLTLFNTNIAAVNAFGAANSITLGNQSNTGSSTFTISGAGNTSGSKAILIGVNGQSGSSTSVTLGTSSGGTSTVTLNGSLTSAPAVASDTVTVGGATQTGNIVIGQSTASQTVAIATGAVTNANTGVVEIGNGATASGGTRTIRIGINGANGSNTNISIGSTAGTSTTTLNGAISLSATTQNIDIGTLQTGGTINIGGDAQTGAINIGRATTTNQTVAIAGGNVATGGLAKTVNIGTGSTAGNTTVTISSNAGTPQTNILGNVAFTGTTHNIDIGTSQTTGTVTIGSTTGTGNIVIGRTTTSSQNVLIASASATGGTRGIDIGFNGQSGSTTTVRIGSGAGISTVSISGTTLISASNTQTVDIATAQGTGAITIGGSQTTSTGNITLGQSPVSQTINIANAGLNTNAARVINIGTGAMSSGATTAVTIGVSGSSSSSTTLNGVTLYASTNGVTISTSGASQSLDLSTSDYFSTTITANTTFTFTNPPASGRVKSFMLEITNGGNFAVTWPTTVKWADGAAPSLTVNGIDILIFITDDGGSNYRASMAIKNSR